MDCIPDQAFGDNGGPGVVGVHAAADVADKLGGGAVGGEWHVVLGLESRVLEVSQVSDIVNGVGSVKGSKLVIQADELVFKGGWGEHFGFGEIKIF